MVVWELARDREKWEGGASREHEGTFWSNRKKVHYLDCGHSQVSQTHACVWGSKLIKLCCLLCLFYFNKGLKKKQVRRIYKHSCPIIALNA